MKLIPSVRGMRDLPPAAAAVFRRAETAAADCFALYGYGEIRTPVLERAELFRRQLGEESDIVQKEMYAFSDVSGEELCLRPEATVPTVRAAAAANLQRGGIVRLWYGGPMFRRERPQKGRYRQFWQLGAEALGDGAPDPQTDAEQILMATRLWKMLKVESRLQLSINNLGDAAERAEYRKQLSAYFCRRESELPDSARARIHDNPMRILDGKYESESAAAVVRDAPQLRDSLGDDSRRYVARVLDILAAAGIAFTETPSLVRGLDYYNLTVFEWTIKDDARRQNALCGGGRYDGLSAQIGGPPMQGCGFALGLDRLVSLLSAEDEQESPPPDCVLLAAGASAEYCARVGEMVRAAGLAVVLQNGRGNLARMLKKADGLGAPLSLILGEDEEKRGVVSVKRMADGAQISPPLSAAAAATKQLLTEDKTGKTGNKNK